MSIVCNCNQNAMLLTVRKEGPNTGRQFYKCSKPQGSGCDFFLWADTTATSSSGPSTSTARNGGGGGGSEMSYRQPNGQQNHSNNDSETCCDCGDPARLLTVQKEGPNQGRQFHACAKPRDSQCRFFQWTDEAGASGNNFQSRERFGGNSRFDSNTRGRGRGRGRGRSNESSSNEPGRKARKCGSCGQEGKRFIFHFSSVVITVITLVLTFVFHV